MSAPQTDEEIKAIIRKKTIRAFAVWGLAAMLGLGAIATIFTGRGPTLEDNISSSLRRTLEWNETVARTFFRKTHLAPEFGKDEISKPRENGEVGLEDEIELKDWKLHLEGPGRSVDLSLDDIKAFPQHEMITELKCIEGWSSIIHWKGPRLADVLTKYQMVDPGAPFNVGMETPDGEYYVGIDGETALHPQTLLAYEKNDHALTQEEGFPLRLATPLKYGIKNIKRVAVIRISKDRPKDYWAERSYDYYAGH